MQIISFFAPKGGVGCTLATVTAAMALVEAGKRVLVLDLTDPGLHDAVYMPGTQGYIGTRLSAWGKRMENTRIGADRLKVAHVTGIEDLHMGIATAQVDEADVILIDTPSRPTDLTLQALDCSNLTVTPASSGMEAALITDSISDHYRLVISRPCGLVTGTRGPEEDALVRLAFLGMRTFETTLPYNTFFQTQIQGELLFNGKARRGDARIAQRVGQAFGQELIAVAENRNRVQRFTSIADMPVGKAVDHWRALAWQNRHLLQ